MKAKKFYVGLAIVVALLVVFLMMGPLYVVNEGSQVVVTRFGQIVESRTDAGLYFKVPFIDTITTYPKLILSLDGDSQRIPTAENQFIIVDTTSRWRISKPELFYQSFKTLDAAYIRISDIIDSATRTVITQHPISEIVRSSNLINDKIEEVKRLEAEQKASKNSGDEGIASFTVTKSMIETNEVSVANVSKGRDQLSIEMAEAAKDLVSEYGVELIDIVLRQIKYSDELTESVYNRMITDRKQVAQEYRAAGEGEKASLLGKLERDKKSIESETYKVVQEIMGEADAEASKIYADAYGKDPEFYEFYRSMESYKKTIPQMDATFSTNMDYFDYLYDSNGR